MLFGEMTGRIFGDGEAVAGAEDETIHGPVGNERAHGRRARVSIRRIIGNSNMLASSVGVIIAPDEDGRLVIVLGIVVSQRGAEVIGVNRPAVDALTSQRSAESIEITAADRDIREILGAGADEKEAPGR